MKKYYSYLLRIWEAENPKEQAWLASLEDPHTRQLVSFTNLERLFEYILAQTHIRGDANTESAQDPDRSASKQTCAGDL